MEILVSSLKVFNILNRHEWFEFAVSPNFLGSQGNHIMHGISMIT